MLTHGGWEFALVVDGKTPQGKLSRNVIRKISACNGGFNIVKLSKQSVL